MSRLRIIVIALLLQSWPAVKAQDTFSILGMDSVTGEFGAAGASCVDLFAFPLYANDFITELFPDTGAIASQASYLPANQANARARMRAGDSPAQIMSWLNANDVQGTPQVRQYGALRKGSPSPLRAAHTGTGCMNYKNHIVGPNYTIHGNILQGQHVLDSMEARFLREEGDLACKLMAAMQGAKMIGADTRCTANGSSSLFAFLKVTQPTDTFGKPSLLISLKTPANAGIEPIDSLQVLFNAIKTCTVENTTGLPRTYRQERVFSLYPNPASGKVHIGTQVAGAALHCRVLDIRGLILYEGSQTGTVTLDVSGWSRGVYVVHVQAGEWRGVRKLVIE